MIQTGSASVPTEAVAKPASPPSPQEKKALDLGGDFGAMFGGGGGSRGLDTVTESASNPRSLTSPRNGALASPPMSEPLLRSDSDGRTATGLSYVPNYKKSTPSPVEDEDAKLLRDSFAAMKFLNNPDAGNPVSATEAFYNQSSPRQDPIARKPVTIADSFATEQEDNMFEGRAFSFARSSHRYITQRTAHPPRSKVMTPAQFEKYKQDKERQGMTAKTIGPLPSATRTQAAAPKPEEDEEDDINYDDDEDEAEKSRQQVKQRRKQEAHMAVYRQQMMKVTGEHATPPLPTVRPNLPTTNSAPQLSTMKALNGQPTGGSDEDEDDEVPLAILQAHGFPAKNRPPTRLSMSGSNPNLRNSYQPSVSRPQSVMGDPAAATNRRASTLPAFARNLPQDPFVGASIHKPAVRESLSFHEGNRNSSPLPPGGLVGVIANEERSRAMRRGSPNVDANRPLPPNMYAPQGPGGYDHVSGIPHQMMYNQGGMGMPGMQPPGMSPGEQAQQQMTSQMQQFMQMQMQFMQMMAMNQNQHNPQGMQQMPQMPQMPSNPYQMQGGIPMTQSTGNLTSRQSAMGMEPMTDRFDPNMRTMSMIQPPSMPIGLGMGPNPGYAGSIHGSIHGGMGYAPSIAPSERSNIGLASRYRPVSQAVTPSPKLSQHSDPSTMAGALTNSDGNKSRASPNVSRMVSENSDDDEESGWASMKAKRDKKRTLWRRKKPMSEVANEQIVI